MSHLADACALITFLTRRDASRLMPESYAVMLFGDPEVLSTTVWEITRKVAIGKLREFWSPRPSLGHLLRAQRFRERLLDWEVAERANTLPQHHRDPMDRLLIASALHLKVPIITSDRIFRAYGVETVW